MISFYEPINIFFTKNISKYPMVLMYNKKFFKYEHHIISHYIFSIKYDISLLQYGLFY
jgi:hypothetical protein